ncbi:hypothetical protein OS965_02220 [Streptomyces sp. H27-G5]|uniref:hypothetical protein n=1 Tax=Streptomyces sp. H27-G5 TaxID=2996698 RepID=UPI0022708337|nr:hypothetical protein [Streptomyces sp. H27-G5]MCY0916991.1 hypothetical protein [Streptomyces sp. H27-G5]
MNTTALCPDCQHDAHDLGDRECEQPIHHGPSYMHRCLCLARSGANTVCPPQMDCQGGTLGYADVWYLQRGHCLRAADGRTITPAVLLAPPAAALCRCDHRRDEHITVSGRLLCDRCDPDALTSPGCDEYTPAP